MYNNHLIYEMSQRGVRTAKLACALSLAAMGSIGMNCSVAQELPPSASLSIEDSSSENLVAVGTTILESKTTSMISRSFSGAVVARRSSELGFKRIGRVESMVADQGDMVRKGDRIAGLDTASLKAEIKILEAEKRSALARLAELNAGPRKETIEAAKAQLKELQAVRDQMSSTYQRRSRLANSDAIAAQDIEEARYQLSAADAKLVAQERVVAELEAGTRPEQIDAQSAMVAKLDASIESISIQITESEIVAPYDGVIAKRHVDEGAIVQPGVSILKIVEVVPAEAWVGLPPDTIASLHSEKTYLFTSNDREFQGKLQAVLPELDSATRTQTAIFQLDIPSSSKEISKSEIAIGQLVHLQLTQEIPSDGYWVPLTSLMRGTKGLWSVFLVLPVEGDESNTFTVKKSDVEIVQIDSNRVLISGAVQEGDRIVHGGVQKLTDGQKVKLAE